MNFFRRCWRWGLRRPASLVILNTLTGHRGMKVKVGGKWPMRILYERGLVLDFRHWEEEFAAAFGDALRPGDVVFDVGAENGEFAALAGLRVGGKNLYLFEPNNAAWQTIKSNFRINRLDPPGGTWEGFVTDPSSANERHPALANDWPVWKGEKVQFESLKETKNIPALTLDDYVASTGVVPTVIKMDIEGAEGLALRGAERLFREHKPMVFLSLHPPLLGDFGTDKPTVLAQFKSLGYEARQISVDHEEHWQFWHPQGRRP